MPRIKYIEPTFREAAIEVIAQANAICAEYKAQGYDLTLRQLYYQFVARGYIANKDSEYKRLGGIINDARLAGLLDWDYIVDRTRNLKGLNHLDSPSDAIQDAVWRYHNDKWKSQDVRIEVWIEKDALIGVLDAVCPGLDVDYFSCRGYTSQTEIWGAAQRLRGYIKAGQRVIVLHLGDHDPSGIDMTRDIRERLELFVLQDWLNEFSGEIAQPFTKRNIWQHMDFNLNKPTGFPDTKGAKALEVRRIGLTMTQVRQYNPPPNPAKLSDTRARKYIERYGMQSWELDALDPATLTALVRRHVEAERDDVKWQTAKSKERKDRTLLKMAAERWEEVVRFLNYNPKEKNESNETP